MPPGYSLNWNGPLLIAKMRQAQPAAIADVTTAAAEAAAANTPVDTGRAQRSVQALPATRHGNRTGARWGSFGVPYYIFLELRGNMLRNAADATLSEIGRRTRLPTCKPAAPSALQEPSDHDRKTNPLRSRRRARRIPQQPHAHSRCRPLPVRHRAPPHPASHSRSTQRYHPQSRSRLQA